MQHANQATSGSEITSSTERPAAVFTLAIITSDATGSAGTFTAMSQTTRTDCTNRIVWRLCLRDLTLVIGHA
jgi:hypothetical protein